MLLLLLLLLLLHSFPFFLFFFLCLFFKHFTSITRIHPSVMHTFLIVSSFIHASIHDLHAPLLLCLFFVVCCCCTRLLISIFCVFVFFSPAFIFCWFSCFFFSFALLATFRLIKDNSVIIIVFFFFAFLAVFLYSAVYVWVFRFVCICFSSIYGIL